MTIKQHLDIIKSVLHIVLESEHKDSDTRRDFIISTIQAITPDDVDPLIPELVETIEHIIDVSQGCCSRVKRKWCCCIG